LLLSYIKFVGVTAMVLMNVCCTDTLTSQVTLSLVQPLVPRPPPLILLTATSQLKYVAAPRPLIYSVNIFFTPL